MRPRRRRRSPWPSRRRGGGGTRPGARAGVVVRGEAPRQEPHTPDGLGAAVVSGERPVEPTEGAGAEAAEDDPACPRVAQDHIDPMRAPDAEEAHQAAAADIDQVLRKQVLTQVARPGLAAEERDVRGVRSIGEPLVEPHHVVVGVAAGRWQEADLWPQGPGQGEDVLVEQGVLGLHRKAPAAEGNDLRFPFHHLAWKYRVSGPRTSISTCTDLGAAGSPGGRALLKVRGLGLGVLIADDVNGALIRGP